MSNLSQFAAGGDPQYWVSDTTYALGKTVRSPIDHQRYVRVVAGAGTTDPANDATNWRPDGGRAIKSTQRGVINIPHATAKAAATISSVVTAKTQLRILGGSGQSSGGYINNPQIELTNSTTITATCNFVVAGSASVSWELTEYY